MGQGAPLIILHGLFGTSDNWQTLGRRWAEHYTVFMLDQRNHGRSSHLPVHDYPSLAADVHTFMEQQGIYQTHLLGHSMGGKTAMEFALEFPDQVDKLIVVDIAPKTYEGGHDRIFEALAAIHLDQLQTRQEAEQILRRYIPEDGIIQFLLKNLSRTREGHFEWKMNLPVLREWYPAILAAPTATGYFTGDTLFVRGAHSDYILDSDLPEIRRYFPNFRLETVPEAGHWVHAEAPDLLSELVLRFLG